MGRTVVRRFGWVWFPSILALYALLGYSTVWSERGLLHLFQLTEERRVLETQVRTLLRENDDLKERIRRLHTDDLFLEQLARNRLVLVREHDIVYRFHPTKPSLTQ